MYEKPENVFDQNIFFSKKLEIRNFRQISRALKYIVNTRLPHIRVILVTPIVYAVYVLLL